MTPPIHIKIVSGITSALWLALGLRNVFAPGSALPALPKDDKLQLWYWNAGPSALTTGQKAYSNLLGSMLLIGTAVKLTTIFSDKEGTFLRRNLFVAFGGSQLFMVANMNRFQADAKKGGASLLPFSVLIGGEALMLLWDAFM